MKSWVRRAFYELKILPWGSYLLVLVAFLLLVLTHGVLEEAVKWRKHYIENMESFFPLAIALITAPLIVIDADQGMIEQIVDLPYIRMLHLRLTAVWTAYWSISLVGVEILNLIWGPVHLWEGLLAAVGPALFLTGLGLWGTLYSGRVAVGYLLALGLPTADLILRIIGVFTALPWFQLLDTFAYRWNIAAMPWWIVKIVMAVIGLMMIELSIRKSRRHLAHWL